MNNPILMLQRINQIKQFANGDADALFKGMMESNPKFREFVEQNKGKTPEEICSQNGIDSKTFNEAIKAVQRK